ncbi:MAG: GGDEF domain-containing protein [Acidobacteriaceae bacterium]|nr:GGDEF domain-containing protein [Acidobacteriaceae bacterium]
MPSILLDTPTILIVVVLCSCVFGCLFLFNWRQQLFERVFLIWGCANLSCGCGSLLFGLYAQQGRSVITAIANGLLIAFFSLTWAGLRSFDARPIRWWAVWAGPIGVALLFCVPLPSVNLVLWHIYAYSLVSSVYCLCSFVECWRGQQQENLFMRRLAMSMFLSVPIVSVLRISNLFRLLSHGQDAPWIDALSSIVFLTIFLIWSLSILLMLNERYANSLLHQAQRDALTGVLNRRGFRERADLEIERCLQVRKQVWLLLYDLDHFKTVNDTHGHEAGDRLLQAFIMTARQFLRPEDLIGRHGGEEFCLLLPDYSREDALLLAEEVRVSFQTAAIEANGLPVRTTVSAGGCLISTDRSTLQLALNCADEALYEAKRGRNSVVFV